MKTSYHILTFSFKKPSLVRNGGESTGLESGLKPLWPLNIQLSWKLSQIGTVWHTWENLFQK